MNLDLTYQYVETDAQLIALCAHMQTTDVYVLDTEFIRVNTLKPILGLLQINVSGTVYVVDGYLDLTAVWALLFNASELVFHACNEDIELIYHYAQRKPLTNVFDTQIALAFLNKGVQCSYQSALSDVLGVAVDKGESRSDWLARPLRPEQLQYAANDVIYLAELAKVLKQQLIDLNLYTFMLEDCQQLAQELASELDQDKLYVEFGNYRHTPKQLMQVQQLCAWREEEAVRTNKPKSHFFKQSALLQLIEVQPNYTSQLVQVKDLKPIAIRQHGKKILDLLHDLPDVRSYPDCLPKPYRIRDDALVDQVNILLEIASQKSGVPLDVLMRKKWLPMLFAYVANPESAPLPAYLLGWRYSLVIQAILAFLMPYQTVIASQINDTYPY